MTDGNAPFSQPTGGADRLLDRVASSGAGAITRHDDALSTKFEGLLEHLQTPAARKGLEAAFHATPAELGRAAVEATRRRR